MRVTIHRTHRDDPRTRPSGGADHVPVELTVVGSSYEPFVEMLRSGVSKPLQINVAPTSRDEDVCPLLGHALVVVSSTWTQSMKAAAPRVRLIQMPGAGWDKMDSSAVPDGVLVANCYEHESAIAEYVMMVALALSRRLIPADRALRADSWEYQFASGHPLYPELRGKTMGIVGMGRIGRAVAKLAAAFRMTSIAVDESVPDSEAARQIPVEWVGRPAELQKLLRRADYVVLAAPLTDTTRGLIGRAELANLKSEAFLINTARAELIEESDLYDALRNRSFAGAALDPWWFYPLNGEQRAPSRFPFRELNNVIMTPHYCGSTIETVDGRMQVVAANVNRFLRGEPVVNIVNELSRA
ncbi:MAG: hydroxyacid dehydrogenase [Candidatus Dormibacteraeota bacterium]|nr:hydroxyacid dehydrogenase [Candidatus Dormibacteraeota bacterium]